MATPNTPTPGQGRGITIEDTRGELDLAAKYALLDTFAIQNARPQLIHLHTAEFSAVCPGTGLPDIGILDIEYIPSDRCVELKALKYYLTSFRQDGIFQEPVADVIFGQLMDLLEPRYMKLVLRYNTRGGIDTVVTLEEGERQALNPSGSATV